MSDGRLAIQCPYCNARYVYDSMSEVQCQNCGKWVRNAHAEDSITIREPSNEPYLPFRSRTQNSVRAIESELARIYVHGIVFSMLSPFIYFAFVPIAATLVWIGSILGLVLSILVLIAMIGGVNIGLSDAIWNIKTRVRLPSVLAHGGILLAIMLPLGLLNILVSIYGIVATLLVGILVHPFVYGFIFRTVALQFELGQSDIIRKPSDEYRSAKCPRCGARYSYHLSSRQEDGSVSCQNCAHEFMLQVGPDIS
ncbi:MAG: hypothetical protein ACFFD3_11335 [Candidatus Thorarchaeota archaeon]